MQEGYDEASPQPPECLNERGTMSKKAKNIRKLVSLMVKAAKSGATCLGGMDAMTTTKCAGVETALAKSSGKSRSESEGRMSWKTHESAAERRMLHRRKLRQR